MRPLRILFVAPYIPSSIRVRSYRFLKGLAKKGHDITFIGQLGSYASPEDIIELKKICTRTEISRIPKSQSYLQCAGYLATQMPLQVSYCYSKKTQKEVASIVSNQPFDIIHIEHIRAAYTLPKHRDCPAVYDSVDCITSLYRGFRKAKNTFLLKMIDLIESKKLEKYESALLEKFDAVLVSAQQDKKDLKMLCRQNNHTSPLIKVVQNGVDSIYFQPRDASFHPNTIVFTGKMGYSANELAVIHFVHDILPLIILKKPEIKFYIVGANPSKRVKQLHNNDNVIVTGWVPDIRKYLQLAHVVVCPVRVSGGIQNKLLEAMSMARPVVTYPGVRLPLPSDIKDVFLTANDPNAFADCVLEVMNSNKLRTDLSKNARQFVSNFYSWEQKIEELEQLYQTLY